MPRLSWELLQERPCADCNNDDLPLNEYGRCQWCHELKVAKADNYNNWRRPDGHPLVKPYIQPKPGHTHSIAVDPEWEHGHPGYVDGVPLDRTGGMKAEQLADDAIRNFVPPEPDATYEARLKFALAFARSIPPEGPTRNPSGSPGMAPYADAKRLRRLW